ncbi:MAG: hypothetical protein H0U76_00345 [Ktedonobacteraceae bacterium]|nr:hypothetical protein [Ktedonobacteraceae bacterium]
MAESIAIYFTDASYDDLKKVLNEVASHQGRSYGGSQDWWLYPTFDDNVSIYDYEASLNEYEDEDLDRLFGVIDNFPSATLVIELRRSQGDKACGDATKLVVLLLQRFAGVVDDLYSEAWTLDEITQGVKKKDGAFLDCYRQANRPLSAKLYD